MAVARQSEVDQSVNSAADLPAKTADNVDIAVQSLA
jgi:hypothetical protein